MVASCSFLLVPQSGYTWAHSLFSNNLLTDALLFSAFTPQIRILGVCTGEPHHRDCTSRYWFLLSAPIQWLLQFPLILLCFLHVAREQAMNLTDSIFSLCNFLFWSCPSGPVGPRAPLPRPVPPWPPKKQIEIKQGSKTFWIFFHTNVNHTFMNLPLWKKNAESSLSRK